MTVLPGTTALDSSVILAALASWHERHVECRRAVAGLLSCDARPVIPDHALLEAFAVLTRLPVGYRISPGDARGLLHGAFHRRARIVGERATSTWALLSDAVDGNVAGGAVYDLRILRTARVAGATRLLTLNVSDFERFGLEGVEIVGP